MQKSSQWPLTQPSWVGHGLLWSQLQDWESKQVRSQSIQGPASLSLPIARQVETFQNADGGHPRRLDRALEMKVTEAKQKAPLQREVVEAPKPIVDHRKKSSLLRTREMLTN